MVVACVAISGRSLWIDEACTATKAVPPTLNGWWQVLSQDRSADAQMPLYMLYVWGWARLFGTSEWSLHAANVPWFIAGAVAFILAFPSTDRRRVTAACVVLLSPFAWYYLDEARPYTMQLGATLLIVTSLVRLTSSLAVDSGGNLQPSTSTLQHPVSAQTRPVGCSMLAVGCWVFSPTPGPCVALFLFGLVVLSGSNLLGMLWAGAALAAMPALLSLRRTMSLARRFWYLWLAAGGLLGVFAGYYLWTLSLGARASASATTTWRSVCFVGYELLGFAGLGPGRLELRTADLAVLRPYLPCLALYAVAIAIPLGAAVLQEIEGRNRRNLVLALSCAVPLAFILAVGRVAHFRVVGRHCAPILAVLLLLCASGLAWLWSSRRPWARVVALVFCGLSLLSCLSLRFSPRHAKDDYRAAAAFARTALTNGQSVWWNAAEVGARYYHLPLTAGPDRKGAALLILNPARGTLTRLPLPQVIITSKPDLYDGQSALADLLRDQRFQPARKFSAFVIWERREPQRAGAGKRLSLIRLPAKIKRCNALTRAHRAGESAFRE
jgi:hypothetical protein